MCCATVPKVNNTLYVQCYRWRAPSPNYQPILLSRRTDGDKFAPLPLCPGDLSVVVTAVHQGRITALFRLYGSYRPIKLRY